MANGWGGRRPGAGRRPLNLDLAQGAKQGGRPRKRAGRPSNAERRKSMDQILREVTLRVLCQRVMQRLASRSVPVEEELVMVNLERAWLNLGE